jgi:hypothetical protein
MAGGWQASRRRPQGLKAVEQGHLAEGQLKRSFSFLLPLLLPPLLLLLLLLLLRLLLLLQPPVLVLLLLLLLPVLLMHLVNLHKCSFLGMQRCTPGGRSPQRREGHLAACDRVHIIRLSRHSI